MSQRQELFGVSIAEIVTWCDVDRTTAARWKRARTRAPASALRLVTLRAYGDASALLGAAWHGWTFGRDGLLYAPGHRRGFTPGEILSLPYLYAALAHARRQQIGAATFPAMALAQG